MKINKVSIIVPVYNEEEAIAADLKVIKETMDASRWDYELIVVNDASTDKTAEIVNGIEGVKLLEHRENKGGGFSRNTGIKAATGDVVMVTDGDGTYPNQDMPRLLERMERQPGHGGGGEDKRGRDDALPADEGEMVHPQAGPVAFGLHHP